MKCCLFVWHSPSHKEMKGAMEASYCLLEYSETNLKRIATAKKVRLIDSSFKKSTH